MMPLAFGNAGETYEIKKIGGNDETRLHLEAMGFVVGGKATLVSENEGNIIVNVKDVRVAISKQLAERIMI